jgi:hypothetical protein
MEVKNKLLPHNMIREWKLPARTEDVVIAERVCRALDEVRYPIVVQGVGDAVGAHHVSDPDVQTTSDHHGCQKFICCFGFYFRND